MKQLQTDMATELATKKSLEAEADDAKTSLASNVAIMNDLKSEKDDLQVNILLWEFIIMVHYLLSN